MTIAITPTIAPHTACLKGRSEFEVVGGAA